MPKCRASKIGKILLVAGGTGGHIWPAIAFGSWVLENRSGVTIKYLSGKRALESEIYRSCDIEPLKIDMEGSPFSAPKGTRIRRWVDLLRAFRQTRRILIGERPDLCVLFGGYVSASALINCRLSGVPAVAHEQNAFAGRVTRLARKMGVPVASGWERCCPFETGSFTHVGVPVRAFQKMGKEEAWRVLKTGGSFPRAPLVAVLTGSLGSGRILEIVKRLSGTQAFRSWFFMVVTTDTKTPHYSSDNLLLLPQRWDIAPLYNLADIVVTRGGASTLTEVMAAGIPTLVIPWRASANDHQLMNAETFAKSGVVRIWDEREDDLSSLGRELNHLHACGFTAKNDMSKRMYNIAETINEKLWCFAEACAKGDVYVGGR